jgi:Ni,Fe-hydrogenase maturation factor
MSSNNAEASLTRNLGVLHLKEGRPAFLAKTLNGDLILVDAMDFTIKIGIIKMLPEPLPYKSYVKARHAKK